MPAENTTPKLKRPCAREFEKIKTMVAKDYSGISFYSLRSEKAKTIKTEICTLTPSKCKMLIDWIEKTLIFLSEKNHEKN